MIDYGRFCIEKCGNKDEYFLFDSCMKDVVGKYKWTLDGKGYACRNVGNGKLKRLHTLIMEKAISSEIPKGVYIDHINQDKLDDRLCNLRLVTPQESARNMPIRANNTSGSTGVSRGRGGKGFRAYITVNRQRIELGTYKTFEEALKTRLEAERYYGFKSKQNISDIINSFDDYEREKVEAESEIAKINKKISDINNKISEINGDNLAFLCEFDKVERETAKINDDISKLNDKKPRVEVKGKYDDVQNVMIYNAIAHNRSGDVWCTFKTNVDGRTIYRECCKENGEIILNCKSCHFFDLYSGECEIQKQIRRGKEK